MRGERTGVRQIERGVGQRLTAGCGMNSVLNNEHREIGRVDGADRDQRAHMHQQAAVALDHEHRPVGLGQERLEVRA